MCSAPKPPTPAQAVPLPPETSNPAMVDSASQTKLRRSGRSSLTIPTGTNAGSGMSGLNIPAA
jgi:hypothetical protein